MSIAEIITEIDACLSRLRQARELLLGGRTELPQKRVPTRRQKVTDGEAAPHTSTRRRAAKNKLQTKHPVAHLKRAMMRVKTGAQILSAAVPSVVSRPAQSSEQSVIAKPQQNCGAIKAPSSGGIESMGPAAWSHRDHRMGHLGKV